MAVATDNELYDEVKCYLCLGISDSQALRLAELRRWLLDLNPDADTSADALLDFGKCYGCASNASLFDILELAFLDQISVEMQVSSFLSRAGITDDTEAAAVRALTYAAISHGWWDLCDLIYPFVGGTAGAHAENLKSSDFTITWNGTVTHDANGVTGNGTTGYGDTGYNPSVHGVQYQLNSAHGLIYRRNVTARTFGTLGGGGFHATVGGGSSLQFLANGASAIQSAQAQLGLIGGSRHDTASVSIYRPTAEFVFASASSTIATNSIPIIARVNADGVTFVFSAGSFSFFTVGGDVDFAMYQTMQSDIQTFQTALGRQV